MTVLDRESTFPYAPATWSQDEALEIAREEGLEMGSDHWEELHALQEYYSRKRDYAHISVRELRDALDEHFHDKGGIKYLYGLFPGGPIAQGCRLAGLDMPAGAVDLGFGSVV